MILLLIQVFIIHIFRQALVSLFILAVGLLNPDITIKDPKIEL